METKANYKEIQENNNNEQLLKADDMYIDIVKAKVKYIEKKKIEDK